MSTFEYNPNKPEYRGDEHEEKFDISDSWDLHLAEIGKSLKGSNKEATDEEHFKNGVSFVSGRQYDDGFGAWTPGQADWVVEKPEKIAMFDENLLNGTYRAQLDFCAVGSPDGEGTPGQVWAVRLWDQKDDKEIPNTRVFSNKLSHGVTEAISKSPKWALDVWKTKEQRIDEGLALWIEQLGIYMDAAKNDPILKKIEPDLIKKNLNYLEIQKSRNVEEWIDTKVKDGKTKEGILHMMINLRNDIVNLWSFEAQKQYQKGENVADETDGWMEPPNWRE